MGSSKNYKAGGGFSEKEYKQIGTTANGIKIIANKKTGESKTPTFSNTPNAIYAKISSKTKMVNQVTVYGKGSEQRGKAKDIDIGHPHINRINGMSFKENKIHVHDYDKNGVRSKEARKPSKKERRLLMAAIYERKKS